MKIRKYQLRKEVASKQGMASKQKGKRAVIK